MKKLLLFIFALSIWVGVYAQIPGRELPGIVRVKVTPQMAIALEKQANSSGALVKTASQTALRTGIISFDALSSELKATKMRRVFPYHPRFEKRQVKAGLNLWYDIEIDEGIQLKSATSRLSYDPNIIQANPIILPKLYADTKTNDPLLSNQWHYVNTGQVEGTPGADINLFKAWDKQMSAKGVIVAIIDEGIDVDHQDLKANMWVNEAELNGVKGVDNDGNGYIDDIYGYNFVYNTGEVSADPHGTHVAGTVGAVNNNGIGVAGIAGGTGNNDGVRLMSCQILNDNTGTSNYAAPFAYAANNGALIAQCSWGWSNPDYYDPACLDAIDYFIEYAGKDEDGNPLPNTLMAGGIVIFAAGNESSNGMFWPGCYDKVLSVGATNNKNKIAWYSNYADWVDVTAPGGETITLNETGVLSTLPHNTYGYYQGTSMACPHVSGIAALVIAKFGSASYTPDMLWQKLISACDSTALYAANPEYVGLLGKGLINAAIAVEEDSGQPPLKVTDLKAAVTSQSFIDVTFTAPSDPDNGKATRYELRYSEQPITADNFNTFPAIYQQAKTAGTTETIKVSGLKSKTKYYFALKSLDIWGNTSEISNILQATTTSSPVIRVTPVNPIDLTIDVSNNPKGNVQFQITNIGEGALLYKLGHHIGTDPRPTPSTYLAQLMGYKTTNNYPQGSVGGSGEDTNPFIAASGFTVTTDKFNLTHIKAAIKTVTANSTGIDVTENPFRLTVVKGGVNNPKEGTAVFSRLATMVPTIYYDSDIDIDLGEQIPFVKGDKIWLVFEFPKEYYAAIGTNNDIPNEDISGQSLYSEDEGETWHALSEFRANAMFRVIALSQKEAMEFSASFAPPSGQVIAGSPQTVTATFDASVIINGVYRNYITILNDDSKNPVASVPINLTVKGHAPKFYIEKDEIAFGTAIIGDSKSEELVIENKGQGTLDISNIVSNMSVFTVTPSSLSILPYQKASIQIKYTPTTTNNLTASLRFTTNEGYKTIALNGSATNPPIASVNPPILTFNGNIGQQASQKFVLKNTGSYKLTYTASNFITSSANYTDKSTGYTALRSDKIGGPAFRWEDMSDAINITREAESGSSTFYCRLPLGFTTTYYGVKYDSVSIAPRGYITMGYTYLLSNNQTDIPERNGPGKIIAPLWIQNFQPSTNGGSIWYKQIKDAMIIEYRHIGLPEAEYNTMWGGTIHIPATGTIDAQLVIFSDGRIEYRYKNFVEPSGAEKLFSNVAVGLENETSTDGIKMSFLEDTFMNPGQELLIAIYPAQPKIVQSVTPTSGMIVPGDSLYITVDMKADEGLLDGTYNNHIYLNTNDPVNKTLDVKVVANIGAESKAGLDADNVDFGKVGKTFNKDVIVRVLNKGGKPYNIVSYTNSKPEFIVTPVYTSNTCSGYSALDYKITFAPTNTGIYSDTIVFETNVANAKYLKLPVKGEGILNPVIDLTLNTMVQNYTIESGKWIDTAVTVKNTGDAPLSYILSGNEWIKPGTASIKTASVDKWGYHWTTSDIDTSLKIDWVSTKNAKEIKLNRFLAVGYNLPFEFNYYGNKYNKIVVSPHAQLLFATSTSDNIVAGASYTAVPIPAQDKFNNMICLLRTSLYPYGDLDPSISIVYGENFDDKVVFTWNQMLSGNFMDWSMRTKITAQIILYKDGRIKFQYKDVEEAAWHNNSVIGIENEDGTDGIEISHLQPRSHNGLVVAFTPGKKYELAPGKTHRIPVRIDATATNDGRYSGDLNILSNDPAKQLSKIEINLTVKGKPIPVVTDTINYNTTYIYQNNGVRGTYGQPFSIANNGTKKIVINSITLPAGFTLKNAISYPIEIGAANTFTNELIYTPTTEGKVDTKLTITYGDNLAGTTKDVVLLASVLNPPKVIVDASVKNKIYSVKLMPNGSAEKTFTMSNSGLSALNYNWSIEYIDKAEFTDITTAKKTIVGNFLKDTSSTRGIKSAVLTVAQPEKETTVTSQPTPSSQSYKFVDSAGYAHYTDGLSLVKTNGGDVRFASRCKAGVEGFNLTHVACWYKSYSKELQMEVKILKGRDYATAKEIHSQFVQTHESTSSNGQIEIDELSTNLYFYPDEYFWVVYRHSSSYIHFGTMFYGYLTDLTKEFYFQEPGGIFELNNIDGFYHTGWVMGGYSAKKIDTPKSWISLTPANGSIEASKTSDIKISLNNTSTENDFGSRYAKVTLTSNDPLQENIVIYVEMGINAAPEIYIAGKQAEAQFSVGAPENISGGVNINVVDNDGDAVTLELIDDTANNVDNAPKVALNKKSEGNYVFAVTTPFGSAGTWRYTLVAKDEHGLQSKTTIVLYVSKTYRAPSVIELSDITLAMKQAKVLNLNNAFQNPDGGDITYVASSENTDIASAQLSNSDLNIFGVTAGTVKINIHAKNEMNLSVDTSFFVTVTPTPIVVDLPNVKVEQFRTLGVDLSRAFSNFTGGIITYTATTETKDIANVTVNGSELDIEGIAVGTTIVKVHAQNEEGFYIETTFYVEVTPMVAREFTVYPNPAVNHINLSATLASKSQVEIRIYNSIGAIVYRKNYGSISKFDNEQIDVSNLPAGVYFVQYLVNDKKVDTKRFVK